MRHIVRLLILYLLPGVSALYAADAEPPMWVASQSPLQSLHLGLLPAVPKALAPGEWSVQRSETWTNVWIDQRPALLIDYEAIDSRLGINVGLPREMQMQLTIEDRTGTGGRLDSLIENFHQLIGNRDQRHTVRRGSVNIEVRDASGEMIVSRHSLGPFSRAATLAVSKRFGDFAGAVAVRVPRNGDDVMGTEGLDTGASLAWSHVLRGASIHAGAGLSRLSNKYVGPVRVGRIEKTLLLAGIEPITARTAVVAQYLFNAAIAEAGPLASGSHEVTVGTRFHVTPSTAFDAGLVENVINTRNGPDFGFHFGLTHDVKRRR